MRASEATRRVVVLESALLTFARHGYRVTSMDAIAREAKISRPGLYFLFSSKESLFRESVSHVLARDLEAIEGMLADASRPLDERLLAAFDRWAGRYVGPGVWDVPAVIADNPELLDPAAQAAPARFEALAIAAVEGRTAAPGQVAQTLISVSVGLKHQADTREDYLDRMRTAIALLIHSPAI